MVQQSSQIDLGSNPTEPALKNVPCIGMGNAHANELHTTLVTQEESVKVECVMTKWHGAFKPGSPNDKTHLKWNFFMTISAAIDV